MLRNTGRPSKCIMTSLCLNYTTRESTIPTGCPQLFLPPKRSPEREYSKLWKEYFPASDTSKGKQQVTHPFSLQVNKPNDGTQLFFQRLDFLFKYTQCFHPGSAQKGHMTSLKIYIKQTATPTQNLYGYSTINFNHMCSPIPGSPVVGNGPGWMP